METSVYHRMEHKAGESSSSIRVEDTPLSTVERRLAFPIAHLKACGHPIDARDEHKNIVPIKRIHDPSLLKNFKVERVDDFFLG